MNVGEAILNFNRFDLLFLLFLFGMFVLGFMQGTIRRLLGLGSMAFSFLFAASLTNVVGPFLADNWNQFPNEYAVMLGFLIVFVAANIAFSLIIQGFYHPPAAVREVHVRRRGPRRHPRRRPGRCSSWAA